MTSWEQYDGGDWGHSAGGWVTDGIAQQSIATKVFTQQHHQYHLHRYRVLGIQGPSQMMKMLQLTFP